jgi:hypothetical protein
MGELDKSYPVQKVKIHQQYDYNGYIVCDFNKFYPFLD